MHLYEAHLAVADTEASQAFYTGIVGLQFAHRDLTRDIIFLWAGHDKRSMLRLWGPTTTYGRSFTSHILLWRYHSRSCLVRGERLRRSGITCQDFRGEQTDEPSVIGWMPSAQLYFRDPDGHSVEFIAVLDDTPDPSFIGSLSDWRKRT